MMCQRIGWPPISTSGFGRMPLSSLMRGPYRPARITTFIPSSLSFGFLGRCGDKASAERRRGSRRDQRDHLGSRRTRHRLSRGSLGRRQTVVKLRIGMGDLAVVEAVLGLAAGGSPERIRLAGLIEAPDDSRR